MITNDPTIIMIFKIKGIFKACLVTYPSIIPAHIVKGTVLKNILNESLNPILQELNLESVLGNKIEAPKIKPHMASTTIEKISKTP